AVLRWLKTLGNGRHFRRFDIGHKNRPAVNVTVDESVWLRWKDEQFDYHPKTLINSDQGPPE
ncbi:MAG: DUF2235 domain-containing protein, partial [Gammaproteobacteria bacterium]|nr:DUF2235 domain-containing protein [Gammaproteobacteria bacterium]